MHRARDKGWLRVPAYQQGGSDQWREVALVDDQLSDSRTVVSMSCISDPVLGAGARQKFAATSTC